MPTITPYWLAFQSGLHIGNRGIHAEEAGLSIPADTLFAALLDTWQQRTGGAEQFAAPFAPDSGVALDPPFLLTSTFPYVGGVRFYPLPADRSRLFKPETLQARGKQVKRMQYFSEQLLKKALQGQLLDDDLFPEDETVEPVRGAALQGGALWFHLDELPAMGKEFMRSPGKRHALAVLPVWKVRRRPRVAVSRISSASNLFHSGRVHFAAGCGLWFGVAWRHPDQAVGGVSYRSAFDTLLQVLADQGLGGERSHGGGAFSYLPGEPFSIGQDPRQGGLAYLLSRYHPQTDELPQALTARTDTAYSLTSVAGWLRSPAGAAQRRKRLWLAAEGSLVCLPGELGGDVSDVVPDYENSAGELGHPVYRYGLACALRWPDALKEG